MTERIDGLRRRSCRISARTIEATGIRQTCGTVDRGRRKGSVPSRDELDILGALSKGRIDSLGEVALQLSGTGEEQNLPRIIKGMKWALLIITHRHREESACKL